MRQGVDEAACGAFDDRSDVGSTSPLALLAGTRGSGAAPLLDIEPRAGEPKVFGTQRAQLIRTATW
jgi:hypothetical protein